MLISIVLTVHWFTLWKNMSVLMQTFAFKDVLYGYIFEISSLIFIFIAKYTSV